MRVDLVVGTRPDTDASAFGSAGEDPRSTDDHVEASRPKERALLDAWREAHWALRLRLRDLMGLGGASEVERLYDLARRADNQLNDFYRARAEELTRRLRDLLVDRTPSQPIYDDRRQPRFAVEPAAQSGQDGATSARPHPELSLSERALLTRFRSMNAEDRAALLRVAQRLAEAPATSR